MFEATPDFKEQLHMLDTLFPVQQLPVQKGTPSKTGLNGIFITHGHMGHYTGLLDLSRPVMGAIEIPVYVMPKMAELLKNNAPWSMMVNNKNIILQELQNNFTVRLNKRITVTPIQVPHRDEFSETVGYKIIGPNKSVLFIPDIDRWEGWDTLGVNRLYND